ncbi:unnamed protein product [Phyllotreta striolata]|uniref:Myb-like domain-containing protein n=1 Tax=Phyllotreta striolata TaxID=444603 RepID=A0A9N9XRF1_PHYSR|nr:unnamed protein product [Phyllotreta striolata]
MEVDQNQIELKGEVFQANPATEERYFVQDNLEVLEDFEEESLLDQENSHEQTTTWNQNETLALINIFSLHKDKFKCFKIKKDRWKLVSRELAKIGIEKLPQKCEIKWRNLLRTYRIYKSSDRSEGKFEFFNELDDVISNDPQFKYVLDNVANNPIDKNSQKSEHKNDLKSKMIYPVQLVHSESSNTNEPQAKCKNCKSNKQKRHEERMVLLRRKLELEERKVKAFEDYVQYLKESHRNA